MPENDAHIFMANLNVDGANYYSSTIGNHSQHHTWVFKNDTFTAAVEAHKANRTLTVNNLIKSLAGAIHFTQLTERLNLLMDDSKRYELVEGDEIKDIEKTRAFMHIIADALYERSIDEHNLRKTAFLQKSARTPLF